MRFARALLLFSLPLLGQEVEPEPAVLPPPRIGPVQPVPLPSDEELLDLEAAAPTQPESVKLEFSESVEIDGERGVMRSTGPLVATADTGMTLQANAGTYRSKDRILTVSGAVRLKTDTGVEILADHGVLDDRSGTVTLTGDVSIYQGQTLQRGERVVYRIEEEKFDASGLRTAIDPILLEAGAFRSESDDQGGQIFVGEHAGVTTDDSEVPAFWARADETRVYGDERVTFRNLKLYAGDTPFFWLPYFSQPLDSDLGYHFVPGARTSWGVYLLNTYGILLGTGDGDPWLLSKWHFDLRSLRGPAIGVDLSDRRLEDNKALTGLSLYYAQDFDPTISRTGLPRPNLNEERWEAALQHRIGLPWEASDPWRIDLNLHAISDNYFLEDFDPRLFRTNPNPDNTIALYRRDTNSLFGALARLRPNEFYRSETRLPELTYDQSRRPIFGTSLLHEGNSQLSFIQEDIGNATAGTVRAALAQPGDGGGELADLLEQLPPYERELVRRIRSLPPGSPLAAPLRTQLLSPGYNRFHTYQELSLPLKFGGFHLTPEAGAGYTSYWNVQGPDNSFDRKLVYVGAEASAKWSRSYDQVARRDWGLDGLLHIFQPYSRFSYVNADDPVAYFPGVDRETFSTRPRTLAPNRFTAIDSLRDWNILRFGLRNRLITKRDGQSYEWLSLNTYFDRFIQDPEFDRNYSNLYNDLIWQPLPWAQLALETQFPIFDSGSGYSDISTQVSFMPNENLEFAIGHQWLDNHPVLTDSSRLSLRAYMRLNEKWGIGAQQVWEFDDGTLELQQYTLHRDFKYLIASLGLSARDNRLKEEYGIVLAVTLKDFPSASLPLSLDAP